MTRKKAQFIFELVFLTLLSSFCIVIGFERRHTAIYIRKKI